MICYKCLKEIDVKNQKMMHGLHQDCFQQWFKTSGNNVDFDSLALRAEELTDSDRQVINSSFFSGAFKKYSAHLDGKLYLLKVMVPEYPELAQTEYICNLIACSLGLEVPDHWLIKFENHLNCFVSYNFMQGQNKSNLTHIFHFLDKRYTSAEHYNCANLIEIIEKKTNRYDDVVKFIQICLFDALIGNHDRHGRNLALIHTGSSYTLSPFYDNPSYLALEDEMLLGAMHEPYGKISTSSTSNPTIIHYVREFLQLGYGDVVKNFLQKIDLDLIKDIINKPYISIKRQESLIRLITRRYSEASDV